MTHNIDEPLSELRSSMTRCYSQDGLGIVMSLATSAGALENNYTCDSFGKLTGGGTSVRRGACRSLRLLQRFEFYVVLPPSSETTRSATLMRPLPREKFSNRPLWRAI